MVRSPPGLAIRSAGLFQQKTTKQRLTLKSSKHQKQHNSQWLKQFRLIFKSGDSLTDPDLQNVLELKVSKKETFAKSFYKINMCKVWARYDALPRLR